VSYWLLKSEPSTFSIEDLEKLPKTISAWDGVRNYQARNTLKSMQKGDLAFFYHSSCKIPGIAGIVEIVKEAYPEKNQTETPPRWFCVDVKMIQKFPQIIPLEILRQEPHLKEMIILRKGNRLSVTPIKAEEWHSVIKLCQRY
jgi:predicted RNA-binding protein with PUA-like domain